MIVCGSELEAAGDNLEDKVIHRKSGETFSYLYGAILAFSRGDANSRTSPSIVLLLLYSVSLE